MKKVLSFLLTAALLLSAFPFAAYAFDSRVVYVGTDGCRLLSLSLSQEDNPWLLYNIGFTADASGRVLTTDQDHPNLIGRTVTLQASFEGDSLTFNGTKVILGSTSVKLEESNELIVYGNGTKAEYEIVITETTSGLPVVLLDTDDVPITTKTSYVPVSVSILGGTVSYAGKDVYSAAGNIKLRGNSTMGYDKKPYRLKMSSKISVLDMGKAKSWTLIANYLDESDMRNRLAFSFASKLNALTAESSGFQVFAPRMRPVEVYLNGEYVGLYDIGDQMQVNSLRVDIVEDEDGVIDDPSQVGYMLEIEERQRVIAESLPADQGGEDSPYFTVNGYGYAWGDCYDDYLGTDQLLVYFQFKSPDPPNDQQISWIQERMQTISDLLYQKSDEVWTYLDMASCIDWYLANEVFKNLDSSNSCYFFKDADGANGEISKVYMGPVWDFDIAAGGMDYSTDSDPTGWRTREDQHSIWFRYMFDMPTFREAFMERWTAITAENGLLDQIFDDIDTFSEQIAQAAERNHTLWHDNYTANTTGAYMHPSATLASLSTWSEQVQYIRSFLKARINWMEEQFTYMDLTPATTTVSGNSGTSVTLPINQTISIQELPYLYLNVEADTPFNIFFNLTTQADSTTSSGSAIGSPNLAGDWQSTDGSQPINGTTGNPVAAGTYTLKLNIPAYLPWSPYFTKLSSNGKEIKVESLTNYVLDSLTVTLSGSGSVTVHSLYAGKDGLDLYDDSSKTLGGSVEIWGTAQCGSTLSAASGSITPRSGSMEMTHQWLRDGNAISGANDYTYTLTAADIGHDISVRVGAIGYNGTITSDTVSVEKTANSTKPGVVPTLASVSKTTLTVEALGSAYEYSLDGTQWQTSPTFEGLTANTAYTVYAREAATATLQASAASDALLVFTEAAGCIIGDVDGDEAINSTDSRLILNYLLGRKALDLTEQRCADINQSGVIDSTDARVILQIALSAE